MMTLKAIHQIKSRLNAGGIGSPALRIRRILPIILPMIRRMLPSPTRRVVSERFWMISASVTSRPFVDLCKT
jgi:hypothetical protein